MSVSWLPILRHAVVAGWVDERALMPLPAWLTGWLLRVIAQMLFFATIGLLAASEGHVAFLAIGHAVMLAPTSALMTTTIMTWERLAGTLPLLVASPVNPLVAFMGRALVRVVDGVASALPGLVVAVLVFDIPVSAAAVPWVVLGVVAVALTCYLLGTLLSTLVVRAPTARNLVTFSAYLVIMAICGVSVPLDFWPVWVQGLARVLPVTHGLTAIREALAGAGAGQLLPLLGLELLVGTLWLGATVFLFGRFIDKGRANGTIEFAG